MALIQVEAIMYSALTKCKISIFAFSFFIFLSASTTPFSSLTTTDLAFIHQTLTSNHPGPVDHQNAWFKEHLNKGYAQAKKDAGKVASYSDYVAVMRRYTLGFKDGHLGVSFKDTEKETQWTGFLLAKRGGDFVVAEDFGDKEAAKKNWILKSCDSVPVADIMKKYVFPFRVGNPDLESGWYRAAPWLLQGSPSQWQPQFKSCEFVSGGKSVSYKLSYQAIAESELRSKINAVLLPVAPKFSMETIAKGVVWVTLPTFHPEGSDLKAMQSMVAGIKKHRSTSHIVFDLRGNTGGSSEWGEDLLESLYGIPRFLLCQGFAECIALNDGSPLSKEKQKNEGYAEWRVSPGNLKHLEGAQAWLAERHGADSAAAKVFSQTADAMREALKTGKVFVRQAEDPEEEIHRFALDDGQAAKDDKASAKPLSSAKLILLTDGFCASACLDFMDRALLVPGTTHVGGSTGGDTLYMDIRKVDLPSGLGSLSFAGKVYRGRPRGHNIAYDPKIKWAGSFADTKGLKSWVVRGIPEWSQTR